MNDFQWYERRAAQMLCGEVMPALNQGYDVTVNLGDSRIARVQVKHANIYHYKGSNARNRSETWVFNQGKMDGETADFFMLFGVNDDGVDHAFLLTANEFISMASNNSTGGKILQITPRKYSRRGGHDRSYMHTNRGWEFEVTEHNARERLLFKSHHIEARSSEQNCNKIERPAKRQMTLFDTSEVQR